MKQVGRSVITDRCRPPRRVYTQRDFVTYGDRPTQLRLVQRHCADRSLRVRDAANCCTVRPEQFALVANLAATFGIEGGSLHHKSRTPRFGARRAPRLRQDPLHHGAPLKKFVPDELRLANGSEHLLQLRNGGGVLGKLGLLPATRALSLFHERRVKPGTVYRNAPLSGELNGEINREPERVMKLEGDASVELRRTIRELIGAHPNRARPLCEWRQRIGKEGRPAVERPCKLCLFTLK